MILKNRCYFLYLFLIPLSKPKFQLWNPFVVVLHGAPYLELGMPQGQYSLVENGKVMPTIPTLEKVAKVFEVSLVEFFKTNEEEDNVNLPLLEKIKIIDILDKDEKDALLKLIDMAISKKKLKDNLSDLLSS